MMATPDTNDEGERLARSKLIGHIEADEAGVFNAVNKDMCELFGYTRDELLGAPLTLIQPHRFRAGHASGFANYVKTRKSIGLLDKRLEVFGLHKTGYEFPISVMVTVEERDGHLLFRNEIRDITLQRESERGRKFVEPPIFTDLFIIVIVESEFAAQEDMIAQLRAQQITNKIVVVGSVSEAEDFVFGRKEYVNRPSVPYLIMLSLLLPEVSGLELLRTLRSGVQTHHIPVVITSILPRNQEMEELIALGNCSYVHKPVVFEELTNALRDLQLNWVIGRRSQ